MLAISQPASLCVLHENFFLNDLKGVLSLECCLRSTIQLYTLIDLNELSVHIVYRRERDMYRSRGAFNTKIR
jgi:hypothetical protein